MITERHKDRLQASALIKELVDKHVQFSYIHDNHEHVISYHPVPTEETSGDVA